MKNLNLIVPHWTMGELTIKQVDSLVAAVASGAGIAVCLDKVLGEGTCISQFPGA